MGFGQASFLEDSESKRRALDIIMKQYSGESSAYPEAPIICHPAGIDHLVDPSLLMEGTIKALGETGRAYGPIQPVKKNQLMDAGQFESDGIVPVITPGHSQHHVSYLTEEYLFVGEAAGVCFQIASGAGDYMRPATPPRFFLDITIKSIDDLISRKPKKICFSHSSSSRKR